MDSDEDGINSDGMLLLFVLRFVMIEDYFKIQTFLILWKSMPKHTKMILVQEFRRSLIWFGISQERGNIFEFGAYALF